MHTIKFELGQTTLQKLICFGLWFRLFVLQICKETGSSCLLEQKEKARKQTQLQTKLRWYLLRKESDNGLREGEVSRFISKAYRQHDLEGKRICWGRDTGQKYGAYIATD
jgi:hypothetical protein